VRVDQDSPAEVAAADAVSIRSDHEDLIDDRYLLDALLENTPDHIYFKDARSRFLRISTALAQWMGLADATEAIGRSDFDFFGPEHARKAFADEQMLMQTGRPLIAIEEQETWQDGHRTWVSTTKVPLRNRSGKVVGIFGISRDITERKHAEEQVAEQARELAEQAQTLERLVGLDELTGLYNRRGLTTVGERLLYEARRTGTSLAVLFIDLDGLKEINDRCGHQAGDDLIHAIATIIGSVSGPEDVAARLGGDEFCLLAANGSTGSVLTLVEGIEQAVAEYNRDSGAAFALSVSIGHVVVDPRSPGSIWELIQNADSLMYERKARRASS
jgi:diguanylate cyclase (GGDEF)-like protein/PAS domain S-box-containing protein